MNRDPGRARQGLSKGRNQAGSWQPRHFDNLTKNSHEVAGRCAEVDAGRPGGSQMRRSPRASPTPGRVCGKYSQVSAPVPPVAVGLAAAGQDLEVQVAAWFGLPWG